MIDTVLVCYHFFLAVLLSTGSELLHVAHAGAFIRIRCRRMMRPVTETVPPQCLQDVYLLRRAAPNAGFVLTGARCMSH